MMKNWTHETLLTDLVNGLQTGDFICSEVRNGPHWFTSSAIPDVMKIRKSYTRLDWSIYEVKATRQDFLSDMTKGKWQDYLPMCSRLYYATPLDGVVKGKADIPEGLGWIARGPNDWSVKVTPKVRQFEPNVYSALAILMSVEGQRRAALIKISSLNKLKHRHNVIANKEMWNRVRKVEDRIKEAWYDRQKGIKVKRLVEELLGVKPDDWNWEEAIEEKIQALAHGISQRRVKDLQYHIGLISKTLKELEVKDRAEKNEENI